MTEKEEARRIVNVNWTYQIRNFENPNWEHAKEIARDIVEEKMLTLYKLKEQVGEDDLEFYKGVLMQIDKL